MLSALKEQRLGEVTVEGGASLLTAFIDAGLWDEARVFTGAVRFGEGMRAPSLPVSAVLVGEEQILNDTLAWYKNNGLSD